MTTVLPSIDAHTSFEELRERLCTDEALIVTLYGYPTGILTREDILEYINRV
jgi:predicted transcriptional regulator